MKIAVYCSAKDTIPEAFLLLGEELGEWIGHCGHTLVYGGATGGLMSRVSDAARRAGAGVIGVVPPKVIAMGRKANNCTELVEVADMAERKRLMREMADCFVCLPGSYGTLDEMFDVIASGTVGEHHKPLFIVNQDGFYESLRRQIEYMKSLRFIPAEEAYRPTFVETLGELKTLLATIS